jgi:hypothetical protein
MRVVSLLPSATDTIVALQMSNLLVGRSHEVRHLAEVRGALQFLACSLGSTSFLHTCCITTLQKQQEEGP